MKKSILELEWSSCSCETCQKKCRERTCWPTPEEAQAIIRAGLGDRLMYDYWVGDASDGGDIGLLSPAIVGYEGKTAPFIPFGPCTFLTDDDLCELHDPGMKPIEGRLSSCKDGETSQGLHWQVAELWNNAEGQAIVREWEKGIDELGD